MPKLKHLTLNKVGVVTERGIRTLKSQSPLLEAIKLHSIRGSNMTKLVKFIGKYFPEIVLLVFRGGRTDKIRDLSQIFANGTGWRLKTLDISPDLDYDDILQLFKQLELLEKVTCKYGALVVTRRIYYEVAVTKEYALNEIVQPMKSRKRNYLEADDSPDSETSSSDESGDDSDPESDATGNGDE